METKVAVKYQHWVLAPSYPTRTQPRKQHEEEGDKGKATIGKKGDLRTAGDEVKVGVLRCPACGGRHSFACSDWKIKPSARLLDCALVYTKMTPVEQSKLLDNIGWCQ